MIQNYKFILLKFQLIHLKSQHTLTLLNLNFKLIFIECPAKFYSENQ